MTTAQPKRQQQKTAAIYARYSSDIQLDRSIEDQMVDCRAYAGRNGFKVVAEFSDRAKSGASLFGRQGAEDLMDAVRARKFDIVIAATQSRIAREPGDIHFMMKRFEFSNVKLHTLSDGEAVPMMVGMRSVMDAEFLKVQKQATRQGMRGRARDGKFLGMVPYGYRKIPGTKGDIEIVPGEAKVVRRVLTEYANGSSPREIAVGLSRDKIPSPKGGTFWSHQTFIGSDSLNKGMLGNPLYIGKQTYGKQYKVKDPETNRESKRPHPEHTVIHRDVPHLRIVDQKLWDAVQEMRASKSLTYVGGGVVVRKTISRNKHHLLSGLLRCGVCSGNMIIVNQARGIVRVRCSANHRMTACTHRRTYDIDRLKQIVIENLETRMAEPEWIVEQMRAYNERFAENVKNDKSGERETIEKQISKLKLQRGRILDLVSEGDLSDDEIADLHEKLAGKERERAGLAERLRQTGLPSNVVLLHPKAVNAYKHNVARLRRMLIDEIDGPVGFAAFRNFIDSIVVQPVAVLHPYVVDVYARPAALAGDVDLTPKARSVEEVIAAEGHPHAAIPAGKVTLSGRYSSGGGTGVIPLGRWTARAA